MTVAEKVLWKQLRAKRFNGHKFRRQVSIGPFIVDFLCIEKRLVVEVDGETHLSSSARAYDARRDRFFVRNGFQVLRVTNGEAIFSLESALEKIDERCKASPPPPLPT